MAAIHSQSAGRVCSQVISETADCEMDAGVRRAWPLHAMGFVPQPVSHSSSRRLPSWMSNETIAAC
jgi:hypothetical protein